MTTLGGGFVGLGIATAILGGVTVRHFRPVLPPSFARARCSACRWLRGSPLRRFPAALAIFQERTRFGRWGYAIGTDEADGAPGGRAGRAHPRFSPLALAGALPRPGGVLAAAHFGQDHALICQRAACSPRSRQSSSAARRLSGGVGSVRQLGHRRIHRRSPGPRHGRMGIEPYVQQGAAGPAHHRGGALDGLPLSTGWWSNEAAPVLEVRGVLQAFPGVKALDDVSFAINPAARWSG